MTEKVSKRRHVFPGRGQSWNKNSQKRKGLKKITGSNTVENYLSFDF